MDFDIGAGLAGFAGGVMSGYKDVLSLKMKEDYEARRDEALLNRANNLEQLRYDREKGDRDIDREQKWTQIGIQKEAQTIAQQRADAYDKRMEQQSAIQNQQFALANKNADRQLKVAEAQIAQMQPENQAKILAATLDAQEKRTLSLYDSFDKEGTSTSKLNLSPAEKAQMKAEILAFGAVSLPDLNAKKAKDPALATAVLKEGGTIYNDAIKQYSALDTKELMTQAKLAGVDPSKPGLVEALAEKRTVAGVATLRTALGLGGGGKTESPPAIDPRAITLTDVSARKLAGDLKSGNQDAVAMYRSLSMTEQRKVQPFLQSESPGTTHSLEELKAAQYNYSNRN